MYIKGIRELLTISILLLVVVLNEKKVNCDIFSSTSHLKNLMYLERHLINTMSEYVHRMDLKLAEIKSYIDEFMKSAGRPEFRGTDSGRDIIANPLQVFQLLKRLTVNWNHVKDLMKDNEWKNVENFVDEYSILMPKSDDLQGAALQLVRLQDTYNLTMNDIAKGKILQTNTNVEMTARDCLFLGKHAFNHGYYGHSIEWFEEAMERANKEKNETASVDEILPFYNMVIKIHDDLVPEYRKGVQTLNISVPLPAKMRYIDGDNEDYIHYQALCRDDEIKPQIPIDKSKLRCYLSDQGNPWLKYQPVKIEVFSEKPYIIMYHDLMTERENKLVRKMAAPLLQRAKVQTNEGNQDLVSNVRTSQTAWFSPEEDEIVSVLNKRIEAVTGLSADMDKSHSELMQVANYGVGGHYTPHYDYLIVDRPPEERHLVPEREQQSGDRTATLMFYLSDVIHGGKTVFPRLGVKLTPKKNSAAFWYNLYRNGEGIIETIHGACPVLIGEKWVSNHWIRESGQTFRRKCSLDPNE